MKTCSKCGFVGEEKYFIKKGYWCKKCRSEYNKKYREKNVEKLKEYQKEYYENNSEHFKEWYVTQGKEKYKQRYIENPETFKKSRRKWREANSEYFKNYRNNNPDYDVQYRLNNLEKIKERKKQWYTNNRENILKRKKVYTENNKEKLKEYITNWRKTPNGQDSARKHHSKRRLLGHEPINYWFKGSEAHHLRYSKTIKERDNDITLYVPTNLHKSISHNGNTGHNMKQINVACLKWYLETTPKEEQNPKAERLYNNYIMFPEPEWE